MPNYCANLSVLFAELDLMDRFEAAKDAGFDAVEVPSPYDAPAQDIVNLLARHDLKMAMISCPPPNYTGGAPGYAAVEATAARFRQDLRRTLRYAKALGAQHVQIVAGTAKGDAARDVLIENLRWAASQAPKQQLLIEAVSQTDGPGDFLADVDQACDILQKVDAPNLRLLFDAYHVAKIHGDVVAVWDRCRDFVGHIQVAQLPHRTEPVAGDIDYDAFFAALERDKYAGWISADYGPATTTLAGLGWMC